MSVEHNDCYKIVRGFPCPKSDLFTKKNLEDAMDLMPEDGDIIIPSYPKTGTTWIQYIILQIMSKSESFPSLEDLLHKISPNIERFGVAAIHAQDKPRFYKHHFPYNIVHKNKKSKIIYTYRNPQDTVVSFYHFRREINPSDSLNFDDFFAHFVSGKVGYGNYFQHILSYYEHRNEDNLLMVSYEKLHANRETEILRIAKFLGEEHYNCLIGDKNILERIIAHTDFDYMRKNLYITHKDNRKITFFRKGIVGDGKVSLSDTQRQILKEAAMKILKGTFVTSEWYPEGNVMC